jgi:hypothetical protein
MERVGLPITGRTPAEHKEIIDEYLAGADPLDLHAKWGEDVG